MHKRNLNIVLRRKSFPEKIFLERPVDFVKVPRQYSRKVIKQKTS